jgi:peroxiredoxin
MMLLCVFILAAWTGLAPAQPPVGGTLPDFTLSSPKDGGEKSYLGLSWLGGSFRVPELKTQVVLIEVFSMYCPYCQADAPKVNQLYAMIEGSPNWKGKIKIIGIGAGNSPYEVGVFKKKYNVSFPLFSDQDFKIHKLLGDVRTPYFIGVRIRPDGSHSVFYSKLGGFDDAGAFLNSLVKLSGLQ